MLNYRNKLQEANVLSELKRATAAAVMSNYSTSIRIFKKVRGRGYDNRLNFLLNENSNFKTKSLILNTYLYFAHSLDLKSLILPQRHSDPWRSHSVR